MADIDEKNPFVNKSERGILLDMAPRVMWGNRIPKVCGYCGETSFQEACLFYGNYVTLEQVRIADGNNELLIGVNDIVTAKNLCLEYEVFNQKKPRPHIKAFMKWSREHISLGRPVLAGFLCRETHENVIWSQEYDHICPIVGCTDSSFYIHDLEIVDTLLLPVAHSIRKDWLTQDKSNNRPYDCTLNERGACYGISIIGNFNPPESKCYRANLKINMAREPDYGAEDKLFEKPIAFNGSLHVNGLEKGKFYKVRCMDLEAIKIWSNPLSKSTSSAGTIHEWTFQAKSSLDEVQVPEMQSNNCYFYRVMDV